MGRAKPVYWLVEYRLAGSKWRTRLGQEPTSQRHAMSLCAMLTRHAALDRRDVQYRIVQAPEGYMLNR